MAHEQSVIDPTASPDGGGEVWHRKSLGAGIVGAVIASLCCLPTAVAVGLGLSLSTIASLGRLLAYQRLFQVTGIALSALAIWWLVRRDPVACHLSERQRDRVSLYVFGAFAVSFVVLNVVVIPLLEGRL